MTKSAERNIVNAVGMEQAIAVKGAVRLSLKHMEEFNKMYGTMFGEALIELAADLGMDKKGEAV